MTTGRHDPPPRAALYQLDDDALLGLIAFLALLGVGVVLFVRAQPVRAAIVLTGVAGGRAVTIGFGKG